MIEKYQEINNHLEQFKSSIDVIINQNNQYINTLKRYSNKSFTFELKLGETLEERKDRAETLLDQLKDITERSVLEIQNINECCKKMEEMKGIMNKVKKECTEEKNKYEGIMKDVEIQIKGIILQMQERDLEIMRSQQKEMENKYKQMLNQYSQNDNEKEIKKEKETKNEKSNQKNFKEIILVKEKKQLEEWTGKKCLEILFDMKQDGYPKNDSTIFQDKIFNRSHLVILIEDTMNNKYGYYFNGTVNVYDSFTKTEGSFMFSLKSNGRYNEMMKFEQKDGCLGIEIYNKSNDRLMFVSGGINIKKENSKSSNGVGQFSYCFDYHGKTKMFHPDCENGKWQNFTMKRFTVIEMK